MHLFVNVTNIATSIRMNLEIHILSFSEAGHLIQRTRFVFYVPDTEPQRVDVSVLVVHLQTHPCVHYCVVHSSTEGLLCIQHFFILNIKKVPHFRGGFKIFFKRLRVINSLGELLNRKNSWNKCDTTTRQVNEPR